MMVLKLPYKQTNNDFNKHLFVTRHSIIKKKKKKKSADCHEEHMGKVSSQLVSQIRSNRPGLTKRRTDNAKTICFRLRRGIISAMGTCIDGKNYIMTFTKKIFFSNK